MYRRVFAIFFLISVASTVLGNDWDMFNMFTFSQSLPAFFDFGEDVYATAGVYPPTTSAVAGQANDDDGRDDETGGSDRDSDDEGVTRTPDSVAAITPSSTSSAQTTTDPTPRNTATIRVIVITATPSQTAIPSATPPATLTPPATGTATATSASTATSTATATGTATATAIATEATATATSTSQTTIVAQSFPTPTGTGTPQLTPTGPWATPTGPSLTPTGPWPTPIGQLPTPVAPLPTPSSLATTSAPTATSLPGSTSTPQPTATIPPTWIPPVATPTIQPTATPNNAPVTLPVTGFGDTVIPGDGICNVNEALANALYNIDTTGGDCPIGGTGTDTLSLPSGTIHIGSTLDGTVASRLRQSSAPETIIFQGSNTIINMTGSGRVIDLAGQLNIIFNGIRISGGNGVASGGGILVNGATLALNNSVVTNNTTTGAASTGGGIAVINGGTLAFNAVELSWNSAVQGGGVFVGAGATFSAFNTTISNNSAPNGQGAGVYLDGSAAIFSYATIADNSADLAGGGLYNNGGTVTFNSTALDNNIAATQSDCFATFHSLDYNLISNSSGCTPIAAGLNDQLDISADFVPLAHNGGNSAYHAFTTSSPVYNAIPFGINDCGGIVTVDQIGTARPQNADCDIGAFELVFSAPADTTLLIDTTTDDGSAIFQGCNDSVSNDCSLRGAISKANADATTPYVLTLPNGTYTFTPQASIIGDDANTKGDLDIIGNVTIVGSGPTTTIIDAANLDRAFHILNASSSLVLQNLTVQNGNIATGLPDDCSIAAASCGGGAMVANGTLSVQGIIFNTNTAQNGGAIAAQSGSITIVESDFVGNSADNDGGAIKNVNASLIIEGSSFHRNSATNAGGAIWTDQADSAEILNSTISGNNSGNNGGGIWVGTTINLIHVTIADNESQGVYTEGIVTLQNSLIEAQSGGVGCLISLLGTITSNNYNLDTDSSCNLVGPNDIPSGASALTPLTLSCCITYIHELSVFSNAPNVIPSGVNGCGTLYEIDQVGNPRPQFGGCDIGAYESLVIATR